MSFQRWKQSPVELFVAALLCVATLLTACRREQSQEDGTVASESLAPARFAVLPFDVRTNLKAPSRSAAELPLVLTNSFSILQTELSPAVLVHSETPHLTVFSGLTNVGLGAPKFVAWATRNGPRTFQRDEKLDVTVMAENWVLVWWAGAEGWTNWDCPWVIYLQHKPDTMSLDADGLHMDFPKRAGDVVMMPLYGYEKLPLEGHDFRAEHQLPKLKVPIKTWEWAKVIPRDPLTRVRYWGAATRDFPVNVEEMFQIDGERDELTIRSRFQRLSIADDWRSRRIKLAPVSPGLALAAKLGGFPVRFSERWFDLELPTPFGPCFGIPDVDEYEVALPVLRYANKTVETAAIVERLRSWIGRSGATGAKSVVAKFEESVREGVVDWSALPTALPLMVAFGRTNEVAALQTLIGKTANAGLDPRATVSMEGLWSYLNFTGDASVVKRFWPAVRLQFDGSPGAGSGIPLRAEKLGHTKAASRSLAFVRLAYLAGDREAYRSGCVRLADEFARLFNQERGAEYFYQHQPWHSMEAFAKGGLWLSELSPESGWQFTGGNSMDLKWSGSPDADIGRFLRDTGIDGPSFGAGVHVANSVATELWRVFLNRENEVRAKDGTMPIVRLFPSGGFDEFPPEAGRELSRYGGAMVVSVVMDEVRKMPSWPQLSWPRWSTPAGATWTFGEIRPQRIGAPTSMRSTPVSGGIGRQIDYELGAR